MVSKKKRENNEKCLIWYAEEIEFLKMKVIIDNRERTLGIKKELIKHGLDVEMRQLVSADFILKTKDVSGRILNVGVERKSQSDFLSSIVDKRLIRQLIDLKEHFDIALLIIEGSENIYRIRNFHPNAIRGMLTSIAIDFQIPILYSKNHRDTASLIAIMAKRLEKPLRNISLLGKRKPLTLKERQEYLIESLPGIGSKISKSLLEKFKSVKNIINASEKELREVEKIGKKKTKEIKKIVESEYKDK